MTRPDSLAARLLASRRAVILALLCCTVVFAAAALTVDVETSHEALVGETTSSPDDDYVEANFRAGPENATVATVIVVREYHVVGGRDVKEQLRYQERLLEDDRIAPTLAETRPLGIANVIGFVAVQKEREDRDDDELDPLSEPRPPVAEQRAVVDNADWEEDLQRYERLAIRTLNERPDGPAGGVYAFVPKYYDNRYDRRAHATAIYVYQRDDLTPAEQLRSQAAMRELATDTFSETPAAEERVYGAGIVDDELDRSTTDSLVLVGPLALLLVVLALLYAYRDPLDVLLALFGVAVVLVWTFGVMGLAGIPFNQLFVAVPVLLAGLAIDFSLHAFMRYREARPPSDDADAETSIPSAMSDAIGSVGAAFALVTLTTATGFAASVTSPTRPLRELGFVAAAGIVSSFVVFGLFVPALKAELDSALEARGYDRRRAPLGARGGWLETVLDVPVRLADRAPWLVVALAVLLALGGLAGATTLDTSYDREELHVGETPEALDALPEPFAPGDYRARESLALLRESGFVSDSNTAHVLVEGNVTHPETLVRMQRADAYAQESNATLKFGYHGARQSDAAVDPIRIGKHPLRAMESVAAENETFNETFHAADTTGDGVPNRNLEAVYDAFYAANPAVAETVIHREDGEYRALRMSVYTDGTESDSYVAGELETTAGFVDGGALDATATGQPVIRHEVQRSLFSTVLRGFALTLVIVGGLLAAVYRRRRDSATLGAVTMVPVLLTLAWILGTMAAIGMRFNILTALIASFTIGLGVDYSIHVSERYAQELDRHPTPIGAVRASVAGTGGALLGSAITTAAGFGVLGFAILGPLRSFGAIVAMTILYAFLASVVVFPSLLVIWTRWHRGETAAFDGAALTDRTPRPTDVPTLKLLLGVLFGLSLLLAALTALGLLPPVGPATGF